MGTYELNQVIQLLTAQQNTLDRIEAQNEQILAHLSPSSSEAEILQPSFPAANQPEQPKQGETLDEAETPKADETTKAEPETTGETTGETAGNTQTVGQTRIGAAE